VEVASTYYRLRGTKEIIFRITFPEKLPGIKCSVSVWVIYRPTIVPVVLCGCETRILTVREEL
jgi:hypothetical protein